MVMVAETPTFNEAVLSLSTPVIVGMGASNSHVLIIEPIGTHVPAVVHNRYIDPSYPVSQDATPMDPGSTSVAPQPFSLSVVVDGHFDTTWNDNNDLATSTSPVLAVIVTVYICDSADDGTVIFPEDASTVIVDGNTGSDVAVYVNDTPLPTAVRTGVMTVSSSPLTLILIR